MWIGNLGVAFSGLNYSKSERWDVVFQDYSRTSKSLQKGGKAHIFIFSAVIKFCNLTCTSWCPCLHLGVNATHMQKVNYCSLYGWQRFQRVLGYAHNAAGLSETQLDHCTFHAHSITLYLEECRAFRMIVVATEAENIVASYQWHYGTPLFFLRATGNNSKGSKVLFPPLHAW